MLFSGECFFLLLLIHSALSLSRSLIQTISLGRSLNLRCTFLVLCSNIPFLFVALSFSPVRLLEANDQSGRGDPESIPILLLRTKALQKEPGNAWSFFRIVRWRWWNGGRIGRLPQLPRNIDAIEFGPSEPRRHSDLFGAQVSPARLA